MRITTALLFAIGCAKAPPAPPPTSPPTPAIQATDAAIVAPPDAPPDAPADAAVDAASAPVQPQIVEAKGDGACKVDADCELSSWQPGCSCTGTCGSYPISVAEIAMRERKEHCPKVRTTPCPPPSPCPLPTHRAIDAFCKNHVCWAHYTVLPPRP